MAAGGLVEVIRVVVVELLLDDVLVIVVFLLLFLTVTRAGAIRHGGLLMGGVVGVGLARRGVGRGDHRSMEGVREGLIILRIVHDFRVGLCDKSPEMGVTLRAESCNRCRQRQANPVGTGAQPICPPTRHAFHRFVVHQKFQKKIELHLELGHSLHGQMRRLERPWTSPGEYWLGSAVSQICPDGENSREHSRRHASQQGGHD